MSNEKITCQLCGEQLHVIHKHIKDWHPDTSISEYKAQFPDAPLLSPLAEERWNERKKNQSAMTERKTSSRAPEGMTANYLHTVFNLGATRAALNASGEPIPVNVIEEPSELVPEKDDDYVFNIDLLKSVCMGVELNIPTYLWGHTGTGKTTLIEQVTHGLNRPTVRVQHTINTEEAHIIGMTLANAEGTYFSPGPLSLAMRNGWVYLADEYDFAMPAVLSVYQPVLEGKPLLIKDADEEWRVVKPHPNFRFMATGNTNGSGDESGLYAGTQMQNAANYSRFGICENVPYMPKEQEIEILVRKEGVDQSDATKLVDFATRVRRDFEDSSMSNPIGPRELLYAAMIGMRRADFRIGLRQAFINKLPEASRQASDSLAQRIFG